MYEFVITNINSGEMDIIRGYTYRDACNRCRIDPREYTINSMYHID